MTQSVVVITGALTGIGEAAARAFAQRGDIVVISGRHDDLGAQLAQDLKAAGATDAVFVRADVRNAHELAHLIDTTITSFGRAQSAYLTGQTVFLDGGVTAG